jgi:HicA toxin of bacterial toxin-antitoxin,
VAAKLNAIRPVARGRSFPGRGLFSKPRAIVPGERLSTRGPLALAVRRTRCEEPNQTFGYTFGFDEPGRLQPSNQLTPRHVSSSHRQLVHRKTGQVITIAVHTKKEVGTGLAAKILKEAGL